MRMREPEEGTLTARPVFHPATPPCSGNLSPPQPLANYHPSEEVLMTTEVKCLEYARECSRRAKLVSNAELRERLLDIARNWTERATREPFTSDAPTRKPMEETGTHE